MMPVKIPNVFKDIAKVLPGWRPDVIFDVGANVGQSALAYAAAFPQAKIHSFEPVPASFEALEGAVSSHPNISPHFVALGKRSGRVKMIADGTSTTNKIVDGASAVQDVIEVEAASGAAYTEKLSIDHISFMKIDTEGHDYDVLAGFLPFLNKVDFVQVEAAMNLYNKTHVQFRLMEDMLRQEGFHLFKFYDQVLEFKKGGRPLLRRANPVFINGSLFDLAGIQ